MKRFTIVLMLAFLCGCEIDYGFRTDPYVKKPVVMSIINPDSLMRVAVYWNKPAMSPEDYVMIGGAEVEIAEDGSVVFSGQTGADGVAMSAVYPSAGKKYTLRIGVEGWPEITASTEIPQPASIAYTARVKADNHLHGYILADVNAIAAPETANAVWISAEGEFEDGSRDNYYNSLYSMCAFLDQVNATTDPDDASLRESNITYEGEFIRIQRSALGLAVPFTFSFSAWLSETDWENWDYHDPEAEPPVATYLDKAVVRIISPSAEYDKFRRSQYKQDSAYSPFMAESLNVYSNIANGIGIFAGYILTESVAPLENPERP